jgi:AraC-like DNA-binding protein
LGPYFCIETRDPDEALALARRRYTTLRSIEPLRGAGAFCARWEGLFLDRAAITIAETTAYRARSPAVELFAVYMARDGIGRLAAVGREWEALAGRAFLAPPGFDSTVILGARHDVVTLTVPAGILRDAALAHAGRALPHRLPGPPLIGLSHEASQRLLHLARFLVGEHHHDPAALASPHLRASVDELLVANMLSFLPPDLLAPGRAGAAIGPRQLRRAVEFIVAHAGDPIRIEDVAATAGVSVRTLQYAFRRHHGCTPTQFLRDRRLELARERLLRSGPGTTVTGVALDSGFGHLGDFGVAYRARFGERPSDTLRRQR